MLKKAKIVVLIIAIIATATIPVLVGAKSSEKAKQDFANVIFFAYFRGDTEPLSIRVEKGGEEYGRHLSRHPWKDVYRP